MYGSGKTMYNTFNKAFTAKQDAKDNEWYFGNNSQVPATSTQPVAKVEAPAAEAKAEEPSAPEASEDSTEGETEEK
jgi:hypothetical protein